MRNASRIIDARTAAGDEGRVKYSGRRDAANMNCKDAMKLILPQVGSIVIHYQKYPLEGKGK